MEWRVNQPREFIKPRSNRRDALQFLPSSPTSSSSLRVQYLDDPTRVSISPLFLPVCAGRHTSFIGGGEVDRQSRITISSFLDARGDVSKRKGAQLERYKGCGSLDNFPILINGARPKEATNVGAATLPPWAELHWRELNLTNPHNTGPTALSPCFSFGLYDAKAKAFVIWFAKCAWNTLSFSLSGNATQSSIPNFLSFGCERRRCVRLEKEKAGPLCPLVGLLLFRISS